MTALGLIGTAASVLGNEAAIRFGRRRLIAAAMMRLDPASRRLLGFVGIDSYPVAVVLMLVYGVVVWLDSVVAHRRRRRHRRARAPRRDARGAFDARLCAAASSGR